MTKLENLYDAIRIWLKSVFHKHHSVCHKHHIELSEDYFYCKYCGQRFTFDEVWRISTKDTTDGAALDAMYRAIKSQRIKGNI